MKRLVPLLLLLLVCVHGQSEAPLEYGEDSDEDGGEYIEAGSGAGQEVLGSGEEIHESVEEVMEDEDLFLVEQNFSYTVSDMDDEMDNDDDVDDEDEEEMGDEEEDDEDEFMDTVVLKPCDTSNYGCCPDSDFPAHGFREEGCCLHSEFGCCSDNIRAALGPGGEGCSCHSSEYGCCPDEKTAQRGDSREGCGCAHSQFGCCKDQHMEAEGPNYEGCPCHTFDYGCCEDGVTLAKGPNKEDCPGCQSTEFGCCPDGFTLALGEDLEGCGCAGSRFGCCPQGAGEAQGPDFEGCNMKPGDACYLKQEKGTCEDFSVKWYFDGKEGRCSRFWYGGCKGNSNKFEESSTCEETCVNPPGSGRCYLPKIRGICTGDYERFHYDHTYKQCVAFSYGGCLGNANRFTTKLDCEQSCVRSDNLAICEQALEPGPCMGNFTRWFFDENTGQCDTFTYGGCHGNKNRFMTQDECENSCMHKKLTLETNILCKQAVDAGSCNESHARWGFDEEERKCRPFYYNGCEGNSNNFNSVEECEEKCPDAFPPELEVVNKILNIEEGSEAVLEITVEGNPFPEITWQHDSEPVQLAEQYQLREDRSLVIVSTKLEDAGSWMVIADNGLGKVARKQISLSIYPSQIPIKVEIPLEKKTFDTGNNIRLECKVEGFPIPTISWLKNNARLPKSTRIYVEEERFLVINRASPIDGGAYICRARNQNMQNQAVADITVLQGAVPIECQDQPRLANCALIVRAKYCSKNEKLAKLCCQSCVKAGQIAGPPA